MANNRLPLVPVLAIFRQSVVSLVITCSNVAARRSRRFTRRLPRAQTTSQQRHEMLLGVQAFWIKARFQLSSAQVFSVYGLGLFTSDLDKSTLRDLRLFRAFQVGLPLGQSSRLLWPLVRACATIWIRVVCGQMSLGCHGVLLFVKPPQFGLSYLEGVCQNRGI